jgi:BirA family biotin operon repressor/biotin-[acetyl-CoA-carboxylase] ligase
VIADEQTAGRGRGNRHWFTPPNAALAVSVILDPGRIPGKELGLWSALGGMAVCEGIEAAAHVQAEIKWPNDVLLERKKVAGVLTEAVWQGNTLQTLVLGIGVNVRPAAVPPPDQIHFPATSLESITGFPVPRISLLREILRSLIHWRRHLDSPAFLTAWEERLAFKGEWVQATVRGGESLEGRLTGVNSSGALCLQTAAGEVRVIPSGEIQLRPAQ